MPGFSWQTGLSHLSCDQVLDVTPVKHVYGMYLADLIPEPAGA